MTRLAAEVMAHRDHPEQGYRSCLGMLRLGHHYSDERLEMAAQRALDHGIVSYRGVKRILENGLDRLPPESEATLPQAPPHQNRRGSATCAQGDHQC